MTAPNLTPNGTIQYSGNATDNVIEIKHPDEAYARLALKADGSVVTGNGTVLPTTALSDPAGTAAADVSAHVAAVDPHGDRAFASQDIWVPQVVGFWYMNPLTNQIASLSTTLNDLYLHPFYSGPDGVTLDEFDTSVVTAGTATTVRVGVYTINNQARPFKWTAGVAWATLLTEVGTIATTVAGNQFTLTPATAVTIPANTWYAVGGVEQGTTASTRRCGRGGNSPSPMGQGNVASAYFSNPIVSLRVSGVAGALPASYVPIGGQTNDAGVGIHRSA